MDDALLGQLEALRPLRPGFATSLPGASVCCKLCQQMAPLFDVVDMQKHCSLGDQYQFGLSGIQVAYHRCRQCGFLFTNFFDSWTPEELGRFIYNTDYVLVDPDYTGARPVQLAAKIARLLRGAKSLRILDYGSGSGIFAAELQKAGFCNIESYDPFSSPVRPDGTFDLVTCFEVLEHMPWPEQALLDITGWLNPEGCLIFSQTIQPQNIADIRGAWWYLAPRNGHVSMFTLETLTRLLPGQGTTLHGHDWLWAMAPRSPHAALAAVMETIGPATVAMPLFAPATGADGRWHAAENSSSGRFRWSRTSSLKWTIPPLPGATRLRLRVPVTLEIDNGFAAGCTVLIGNVQARVAVQHGELIAEADVADSIGPVTVHMLTPEPKSPLDVRGVQDGRPLGLGVLIGPVCTYAD